LKPRDGRKAAQNYDGKRDFEKARGTRETMFSSFTSVLTTELGEKKQQNTEKNT